MGCSAAAARCGQDQGQPGRVRGQVPACRIDGHAVAVRAHRNVKPAGQGDAIYGLSLGFRCAADPP